MSTETSISTLVVCRATTTRQLLPALQRMDSCSTSITPAEEALDGRRLASLPLDAFRVGFTTVATGGTSMRGNVLRARKFGQSGMTLIELMIATVVLLVG